MSPDDDDRGSDRAPGSPASLFEQLYPHLVAVARQRLRQERRGHTLQATALVHEAWVRLCGDRPLQVRGQSDFFAAVVTAMRRVLIDHARKRGAAKRGGGRLLDIENVYDLASEEKIGEALAFDELISRLELVDAQAAQLVRLRFYTGLSVDDAAEALGISRRSAARDWEFGRAWLAREWRAAEQ